VGKKTRPSDNGQLDELRDLVSGVEEVTTKKTDRRGMLRMAGGAVLGAAGIAALKIAPASAATGGNFILGCGNAATSDTTLINTGGTAVGMTVQAGIHGLEGVASGGTNEIGVVGTTKSGTGVGVAGQATATGGPGIGVKGQAGSGTGVQGISATGAGVDGETGGSGPGVAGLGTAGQGGLFVSSTGYDAQLGFPIPGGAVGSGRLGMVGRLDVGAIAPNIAPAFQVSSTGSFTFEHELVRGNDSSIWASRFSNTGTNQSRWKRINAVRVDSADGTGAPYAPFRVYDSRAGSAPKKAVGSTTTVPIAGHGTGTSTIPGDAIAVMGNLTATGYTAPGFLALSPNGIAVSTSSVNFITGQAAIANGFIVGLSGGAVQVKVAGSATHFIIDITGYIQ
jgi:hypothetical protein